MKLKQRWFEFNNARFLIKSLDPWRVLDLNDRRKRAEIDDERIQRVLFLSSLVRWEGIENDEKFASEEKFIALFKDSEIREFVLEKAAGLLNEHVRTLEKALQTPFIKGSPLKS